MFIQRERERPKVCVCVLTYVYEKAQIVLTHASTGICVEELKNLNVKCDVLDGPMNLGHDAVGSPAQGFRGVNPKSA